MSPLVSDKILKKYKSSYKTVQASYKSVYEKNPEYKDLLKIENILAGVKSNTMSDMAMKRLATVLKSGMKDVLKHPGSVELMKFIRLQLQMMDVISKNRNNSYRDYEELLEQTLRQKQKIEEQLRQIKASFREAAMTIVEKKAPSQLHREEFVLKNNRAVRSVFDSDAVLAKDFSKLSKKEKEDIKDYIRSNAKKFRTRLSRNVKTSSRHKIDMTETCKAACSTMGIPLRLRHIKPKRQKTKLIMFLDISGSCKEASELMLSFMGQMKEVFPGGCKTFVFVNTLYDVSDIYSEAVDTDRAITEILSTIPTRGVYSDYHRPFMDFCENNFHELTKDSIVFFIGDARNNKNPSGEEFIRAISRRAKKAYWLNTEDVSRWDSADSIFSCYAKYMSDYCECVNSAQLIDFLTNAR